jgi:nucleotide-binding universal stress UspA family protein
MSQQVVEAVLGRLVYEGGFRERFAENRGAVLDELIRSGSPLTPVERRALATIDAGACEDFARRLDSRICLGKGKGTVDLRDIIVYVDGRATNEGALELAAVLAQEHRAQLTGVFIQPEPVVSTASAFVRGKAIREAMAAQRAQMTGVEENRRALFEGVVGRQGIEAEWRVVPYLLHYLDSSEPAVHARYSDLAVVGGQDHQEVGLPDLVRSLLLTSGRPTIVVPPGRPATRIRRILVGWNARREASRALADALPLLVRAEAVEVLIVDGEGHPGGDGQEPGAEVARHLARHGAAVAVRRLSSDGEEVGRVLLSRAASFRADLMVMGAYGHSRLSAWMFGGVTRTVLREARLPVFISR